MYCCLCPHYPSKTESFYSSGRHKKTRHPKRMPCPILCNILSVLDYTEKDACHNQCEQYIESLGCKEGLE